MAAQGVALAIGLLTAGVLSRHLGVDGFGRFNHVFAFFYFFLAAADFGTQTVVVREIAQRPEAAGRLIGAVLPVRAAQSAVSVLLAWATIWLTGFPPDQAAALVLFSAIVPLVALQLPAAVFQAELRLAVPAAIGLIHRVAGLALMLLVVWTGGGILALLAALLAGEALTLLITLGWVRRYVRVEWRIDPAVARRVLAASAPLGLAALCTAVINRVDFVMLERMSTLHELGLYAAAYKVTGLLEVLPLMIMGTVYPLMARYAETDRGRLRALYRRAALGLGVVAIPIALSIAAVAPRLVTTVFGPAFEGAAAPLAVLVWATAAIYAAVGGTSLLVSLGFGRLNLLLNAAGAALNVALNLLLIPDRGATGAALATAITYGFILAGTAAGCRAALGPAPLGAGWALLLGRPSAPAASARPAEVGGDG